MAAMHFVRPPICYNAQTCREHRKANWRPVWYEKSNVECFRDGVLVGNWVENQNDIERMKNRKRPVSDVSHYYDSTYHVEYNKRKVEVSLPEELKDAKSRHPHAYGSHQPEFDPPAIKETYNGWQTTHSMSYIDPRVQRCPSLALTTPDENEIAGGGGLSLETSEPRSSRAYAKA